MDIGVEYDIMNNIYLRIWGRANVHCMEIEVLYRKWSSEGKLVRQRVEVILCGCNVWGPPSILGEISVEEGDATVVEIGICGEVKQLYALVRNEGDIYLYDDVKELLQDGLDTK